MDASVERRLRDHALDVAGDGIRLVVSYRKDGLEALYVRDDLADVFDRTPLESARNPISQIHQALQLGSRLYGETLGEPEGAVHHFENTVHFHVLLGRDRGILVVTDADSEISQNAFFAECVAVVNGSNDAAE